MYGYMVLTETAGRNKCISHHIFGRTTESFLRESRQNDHRSKAALPLEPLIMSNVCERQ
ncbi:unnamed protein product [Soboliphyme baturini]|uniref:Uncharacterized protein n=1 Tax=Soboliphyme baturini TaxID=241478 RepID=A0A183INY3_9BILA|nr:unnamed protein product [Soboliphyme baturini]